MASLSAIVTDSSKLQTPLPRCRRPGAGRPSPSASAAADEREVGEGLREVAELRPAMRIVLLGEQTDIVAQREQPLEELARLVVLPCSASTSTSQNEQARKTPSPGGSPSTRPPAR